MRLIRAKDYADVSRKAGNIIAAQIQLKPDCVLGLATGSVAMVGIMLLWNYLITPLYMTGTSRSDVAAMLIPVFLPFNALKAGFNTALTLLLYKPLVSALRKTGLVKPSQNKSGKSKAGLYLLAALLLVTCILLLLVYRGKI